MKPRFDRPIAHRGLHDRSAGRIENSGAAFEAAIAGGYAIECDVQLSADGVPFIFHDDSFERLTEGSGLTGSLAIADIEKLALKGSSPPEVPQRLGAFLAQVRGRTPIQIELKPQPSVEGTDRLAAAVHEALQGYEGEVTLESFDPNLLVALRRLGVTWPLGALVYSYRDEEAGHLSAARRLVLRHLLHWPWTRFQFVSCYHADLRLPAVRLFRSLGLPVTAWTIRSPAQEKAALSQSDQVVFEGYSPLHVSG